MNDEEKSKLIAEVAKKYKEHKWIKGRDETDERERTESETKKEKGDGEGPAIKGDQESEWDDPSYWEESYQEGWTDEWDWEENHKEWKDGENEYKAETWKNSRDPTKYTPIKEPAKVMYFIPPPPAPVKHQSPQISEAWNFGTPHEEGWWKGTSDIEETRIEKGSYKGGAKGYKGKSGVAKGKGEYWGWEEPKPFSTFPANPLPYKGMKGKSKGW